MAREVGTEGKLGGQAQVRGVSGTWRDLTENVNQLASTLTTQLRAISAVSTSVASGDLTQQIRVAAFGEVAELKDNINQMIAALRTTTTANAEQGWLDSHLARMSGLLQGQRDLGEVCQMLMDEVTPLVNAQVGAFFLAAEPAGLAAEGARRRLGDGRRLRAPRRGIRRCRSAPATGWSGRPRPPGGWCSWRTCRPTTCRSAPGSARPRRGRWSCCRCSSRTSASG